MDRRDFLKAAVAVPAVVALPEIAEERHVLTATMLKELWNSAADQATLAAQDFYIIIHPRQEQDLRDLVARERWRYAYQAWRKDGRLPMSLQAILVKYGPPKHEWETGVFEGAKIITQEKLPA